MAMRRFGRVFLALMFGVLLTSGVARAQTTWYVDDDAPNDPYPGNPNRSDPLEDGTPEHPFDRIQEGLDAAVDGDTVLVADGTYTGEGNKNLDYNGKAVAVCSAGRAQFCIIDCEQDGRGVNFTDGEPEGAVLAGFTIRNGSADNGGAIHCQYNSNPSIRECVLIGNSAERGGGVYARLSNPTLTNCVILENTASEQGGGVLCREGEIAISNCTVTGNSAVVAGGGAQIAAGGEMTIVNSIFAGNDAPAGAEMRVLGAANPSVLTVSYSFVEGGQGAVEVAGNCTLVWGAGNSEQEPLLSGDGIHLLANSPCRNTGDPGGDYAGWVDIDGEARDGDERVDIGADEFWDCDGDGLPDWWELLYFESATAGDPQGDENGNGVVNLDEYAAGENPLVDRETIYVSVEGYYLWDGLSPVWDGRHGPCGTFQGGIDRAIELGIVTVIVRDGYYMGEGNKDIDYKGAALNVQSENGYDSCVIDCEGEGRGFYFHSGETSKSILEGITVRNGYLEAQSGEIGGAGVCCIESSPTLTNCVFEYNDTYTDWDDEIGGHGGGVCGYNSSLIVDNCSFVGNYADSEGGGIYLYGATPTVINCTFYNNLGTGGGVFCDGTDALISDCDFIENHTYYIGGGLYCNRSPSATVVNNCTFLGNTSVSEYWGYGGGAGCMGDNAILVDCSFGDNRARNCGGAVYCSNTDARLINCSMTRNKSRYGAGVFSISSHPMLRNCIIAGNQANLGGVGYGGGVYCYYHAYPTLINCTISGNTAINMAGGISNTVLSHSSLVDCVISNNVAGTRGGGIVSIESCPSFTNCTITGNTAGEAGGGLGCTGAPSYDYYPTLNNCILWNNAPYEIDSDSNELEITYCSVAGSWEGEGNIDADPLFVDPDGADDDPNTWEDNDYRLRAGSPCIDAGNNLAVPLDVADLDGDGDVDEQIPFDLDGNPRFVDDVGMFDIGSGETPVVDMGAYEFQGSTCFGDLNFDGEIGIGDLAELLGSYGGAEGVVYADGDLDRDGDVDIGDLAELLGVYGDVCE